MKLILPALLGTALMCANVLPATFGASTASAQSPNRVARIAGSIRNGVYISPSGTFQVRVPPLMPGASIVDGPYRDRATGGQGWGLALRDDLCRGFGIEEWAGTLNSLDIYAWTQRTIVSKLKSAGIADVTTRRIDSRYGPTVAVVYRRAEGSPCAKFGAPGGPQTRPSAEFVHRLLFAYGHFYHLWYVLGTTPGAAGIGAMRGILIAPAERVFDQFFAGFEVHNPHAR